MTTAYATELLVTSRSRELHREACTSRLAMLARCCTPSVAARAARHAAAVATRLRAVTRGRSSAAACCTA